MADLYRCRKCDGEFPREQMVPNTWSNTGKIEHGDSTCRSCSDKREKRLSEQGRCFRCEVEIAIDGDGLRSCGCAGGIQGH